MSPRKKLRPYLHQLQIKYPQARLLHKKKLGKAVRRFLKQARQPENPFGEAPSEQRLIEHTAQTVQQAVARIIPSAPAGAEPALIATALALLKKNHPKKKQDLVRLLTERSNPELAQEMLAELQSAGKIHIDAAENVRYR